MPKGGARVRSGPAPDPNALRRDRPADRQGDATSWIRLPAAGREGEPPEWPLSRALKRELTLWAREWKRPQAVAWEKLGLDVEVGVYVRTLVAAEAHDAGASTRTLLRQQMDSLGLTVPGLARNRWIIDGAADEPAAPPVVTDDRQRSSAKARFLALEGGLASR
jgi:hypothetical protein